MKFIKSTLGHLVIILLLTLIISAVLYLSGLHPNAAGIFIGIAVLYILIRFGLWYMFLG